MGSAGEKSNLHPGGTEGSKSIYNGHMSRARETAHKNEESEEKTGDEAVIFSEYEGKHFLSPLG